MSDYSYSDIIKMQNNAMRRVEEMNSRANNIIKHANSALTSATQKDNARKLEKPYHVPMPDDYIRDLREYAKKAAISPYEPEHKNNSLQRTLNSLVSGSANLPKSIKNVLSDLNIDSDRALLLSLILLLAEEKSDEVLIIALLYMMI